MRLEPFSLIGTHMRLVPLTHALAPALLAAGTRDRSTYGHTAVPDTAEAMTAYIDGLLGDAQRDTAVPFAQVRVADDAPVGCTRFMNVLWWAGRDTPVEVEIGGTWLATDAQRSPINTEAKLLLLRHAFEQWGVFRVAICTDARNERSRAAIERIGGRLEGILRSHRPSMGHLVTAGTVRDTAAYSIIDSEWPEVRARLEAMLRG
ncbi:MAG: GNAT family protein [Actinomycetota bacterium]|nr:GNAT family protein [Actinomycetota bacterium]